VRPVTIYSDNDLENMLTDLESAQDERILNEKRRHRDQPFDVHSMPSAATRRIMAIRLSRSASSSGVR
jgi:hypothetical protein